MSEKWEELGLSDNFIFQKVMLNEKLCKKILSEILGKEVTGIDYAAYEQTIEIRKDAKGIRLDVYVKDEEETVYNVEIQNTDLDNLPKRSRYYHDMIDLDLLEKGEEYENLNNSYVIFICTFDVFGKDYYKYTFVNRCEEVEELELGEGSTTIFMNTRGHKGEISKDCEAFLKSIEGKFTDNEFSAILEEEVEKVKKNQKWRKEYMFMSVWLRDAEKQAERRGMERGLAKGMAEGIERGMAEGIEKGMEKGMEQGKVEGKAEEEKRAIKNMLKKLSVEEVIELGYEENLVLTISKQN